MPGSGLGGEYMMKWTGTDYKYCRFEISSSCENQNLKEDFFLLCLAQSFILWWIPRCNWIKIKTTRTRWLCFFFKETNPFFRWPKLSISWIYWAWKWRNQVIQQLQILCWTIWRTRTRSIYRHAEWPHLKFSCNSWSLRFSSSSYEES